MPFSKNNSSAIPRLQLSDFGSDLLRVGSAAPKTPAKSSFVVYSRASHPCKDHISASRRDYYKISFITRGSGTFTLGGRRYHVKPPALLFINPFEIKTWQADEPDQPQDGYYCIFTEQLFDARHHYRNEVLQHPLFQLGAHPVLPLNEAQCRYMQSIFAQLLRDYNSTAAYRQEAFIIYLQLLLLEVKRIGDEVRTEHRPLTAGVQLAQRFTDLLEQQFPVESTQYQLQLRTARDFAAALHVHPNHLNATVKKVTGRTVSEHIKQRILLEAKLLLLHTDWQIAAVAWCLGFDEPGNFTHFFRSQTGQAPHVFRTL